MRLFRIFVLLLLLSSLQLLLLLRKPWSLPRLKSPRTLKSRAPADRREEITTLKAEIADAKTVLGKIQQSLLDCQDSSTPASKPLALSRASSPPEPTSELKAPAPPTPAAPLRPSPPRVPVPVSNVFSSYSSPNVPTKSQPTDSARGYMSGHYNAEDSATGDCAITVNIMTTVIEVGDELKEKAQLNALASLSRLQSTSSGHVRVWLFTASAYWSDVATKLELKVVNQFETNSAGTPIFSYMFQHVENVDTCAIKRRFVFDGYVNGDIILTSRLHLTLVEVMRKWFDQMQGGEREGVLVIGKRYNVEYQGQLLGSDQDVERLLGMAEVFENYALDYFFFSRGWMSWNDIPTFVVGRRAYDNWLVDHAFHRPAVDLVDATETVLALHLTGSDGVRAGHSKGQDNDHNVLAVNPMTMNVVNQFEWDHGTSDHASYYTQMVGGQVMIYSRPVR
eukprot:746860-Hanusia_phi.AAC.4